MQLCQTGDGSLTLRDPHSGQSYRSIHGAVTESTEVFLDNSNVAERLAARQPTSVLEIGFGTGLNFCLTAMRALKHQCPLRYSSCDYALPPVALIETLLRHNLPASEALLAELLPLLRQQSAALHRGLLCDTVDFELRRCDARTTHWPNDSFDAIYLDGFSASCNPELWQRDFLAQLAPSLRSGGRLATFGVNRAFRNALAAAGFSWQKRPGPAGKREVLIAHRNV